MEFIDGPHPKGDHSLSGIVTYYRLGHQVFHPEGDHSLSDILVRYNMYYVYFVQSLKDKTYYVGSTEDVEKRLKEHNQGKTKSLKSKLPVNLVYIEEYNTKTDARKRELHLKKSWQSKAEIIRKLESN